MTPIVHFSNLRRGAILQGYSGNRFIYLSHDENSVRVIPMEKDGLACKIIWNTTALHFFKVAEREKQLEDMFHRPGGTFQVEKYVDYLEGRALLESKNLN